MTTNSTLSTANQIIVGVLDIVCLVYPPAAPFIGIAEKVMPYIIAATPLVVQAFSEGLPALAAAEKASPGLGNLFKSIVTLTGTNFIELETEKLIRSVFNLHRMTPEEEMTWMNNATPHNDPSQENSKYGSG